MRLVDLLVYRVRIKGKENLPRNGGAVLVSNHTLLLDPGILAHAIRPRRTYFTMLEETALIPFLGTFVRLLGGVPIPERPGALRTLDAAARTALREIGFIHFFPEGECYRENQEIQPFHPGRLPPGLPSERPCRADHDGSARNPLARQAYGAVRGQGDPSSAAHHDRDRCSGPRSPRAPPCGRPGSRMACH